MELIMTWVIKAEHTGAFPGNPSFAWIKRKFYIFMHRHPAPSGLEIGLSYYYHHRNRNLYVKITKTTRVFAIQDALKEDELHQNFVE